MKTFKLLIATVSSLTVIGAATVAFAQTSSNQNQGQNSDRTSSTTNPGSTNSTTQRQSGTSTGNDRTDSTGAAGTTGSTGTTGTTMGRSSDDSMRSADGSTMRTERVARADRN